jgi:hypothetical protein
VRQFGQLHGSGQKVVGVEAHRLDFLMVLRVEVARRGI